MFRTSLRTHSDTALKYHPPHPLAALVWSFFTRVNFIDILPRICSCNAGKVINVITMQALQEHILGRIYVNCKDIIFACPSRGLLWIKISGDGICHLQFMADQRSAPVRKEVKYTICNVFSDWLWSCSAMDRKQTLMSQTGQYAFDADYTFLTFCTITYLRIIMFKGSRLTAMSNDVDSLPFVWDSVKLLFVLFDSHLIQWY